MSKAFTKFLVSGVIAFIIGFLYNVMAQEEQKKEEVRTNRIETREELSTIIGDGGVHRMYVDPGRLFRLSPPREWKIDENPGEGLNVKFIASDNYDIEISIKVTKAKEDLKSVIEELKKNNKNLQEYQLLSEQEYIIDGEKGYMICSYFLQPAKWEPQTKCSEVIYIKSERLIYFKYIAPADDYDKYFSVFSGRLMTFESL